ncbi:MAG TPA: hypothetical protein P5121_25130 [Caldilineaceae bacterium]|nr:hypothetical protein [Caldilineaceae bacterium]
MSTPKSLLLNWLSELFAEQPNTARVVESARQLVGVLPDPAVIRQWLAALDQPVDDQLDCGTCQALLPEFLHEQQQAAQGAPVQDEHYAAVRTHLALCPYCTAAYVQMAEWVAASQADTIPRATTYPTFDLSFLEGAEETNAEVTPFNVRVQQAIQAGRDWFTDTIDGVTLIFGPSLQTQPASGWAVKSGATEQLLTQIVVGEDALDGWEIECSVFADAADDRLCQIEISLYRLHPAVTTAADIPVTLRYGATAIGRRTDEDGIVTFAAVPVDQLAEASVQVALPSE